MKLPSLLRLVTFVAGLSVFADAGRAQSGAFAVVNKQVRAAQTGAASTAVLTAGGYGFDAHVEGTATVPTGPVAVTLPGAGGTRPLAFSPDAGQWEYIQFFDTAAALAAAFPNGTYGLAFGGRSTPLALTGDLYPAPPVATASTGTWSGGTLTVDRTQPLTLTINFSQNYSAGASRLGVTVGGAGPNQGDLSADTSAGGFSQAQLSLTVPANTLVVGRTYTVQLEANRIVALNATSAPGYNVVAVYSAVTTFTLTAAGRPVFAQQPSTQQISNNSTVVFSALAPNATGYQWLKAGAPIAGATGASLVLFGATTADAGAYTVVAGNASGDTTSFPANLTIAAGNDFGRLSNLSILTDLSASTPEFTLGTVIGGANTTATPKPLLIRAVGPSLAQPPLNVEGALSDPKLEVFAGQALAASNDDWAGADNLKTVIARVGAFPFINDSSRDAAVFPTSLMPRDGGYTIRVSGAPGAAGRVLAELYDATSITAFPPATPRLINVSVRKAIDAGTALTAGFVIGGSTSKTVLVRAIGPGLAAFGVPGVMADPRLDLFNSNSVTIASNDNWGGDAQKVQACARVGAFAIDRPGSADAMLLITLVPGSYSAVVRGATGGGTALVEVYEVP
ncbi:MAG: hypothetical protein NTV51_28620 [Verrucomicrobia bacterium]|nr:hypothetical protein [Verrucomicrobiota bacterium]